jgi:hypothetical protein
MEVLEELEHNDYIPNIDDPEELAKRTYGEAREYLKKEYLYIRFISNQIAKGEKYTREQAFDIRQSISSDLGKVCETFLKSIYIKESENTGERLERIWDKHKRLEYSEKKDNKSFRKIGNVVNFPGYDETNKIVIDDTGITVYENSDNVIHQLDKLIDLLSPETKILLDLKVITTPSKNIAGNPSTLDLMSEKGNNRIINIVNKDEKLGILENHQLAYKEARNADLDTVNGNLDFMYHLAYQMASLAHNRITYEENKVTEYKKSELQEIPGYVLSIFSDNAKLLSQELFNEMISNLDIMSKCKKIIHELSLEEMKSLNATTFYKAVNTFDMEEMYYIIYIDKLIDDMNKRGEEYVAKADRDMFLISHIAKFFKDRNYDLTGLIDYFTFIKANKGVKIDYDFLTYLDNRLTDKKEKVAELQEGTIHKVVAVKNQSKVM